MKIEIEINNDRTGEFFVTSDDLFTYNEMETCVDLFINSFNKLVKKSYHQRFGLKEISDREKLYKIIKSKI